MELSLSQAEPLVVDSSLIAASYIPSDDHHEMGLEYTNALDRGEYVFHLPMLVVVEVTSAIRRRDRRWRWAGRRWQNDLEQWESDGKVILYPLNRARMENSTSAAWGADCVAEIA